MICPEGQNPSLSILKTNNVLKSLTEKTQKFLKQNLKDYEPKTYIGESLKVPDRNLLQQDTKELIKLIEQQKEENNKRILKMKAKMKEIEQKLKQQFPEQK